MKLTLKTLNGVKFEVEVEEDAATATVEHVKTVIEQTKPELPALGMKLIHAGKVLKDADTLSSCGIKPNDFLVVMINKAKNKPTANTAPAAAAVAVVPAPPPRTPPPSLPPTEIPLEAPAAPAPRNSTLSLGSASGVAAEEAAATTATTRTDPPPPQQEASNITGGVSEAAVESLTSMGFPEAEVRHCLQAAGGNPELAVDYMTHGIPEAMETDTNADNNSTNTANPSVSNSLTSAADSSASSLSSSSLPPLHALRTHPQFNDLRHLVQNHPATLQQLLTQIGQQQPDLLREINENPELFLQLMNEPIVQQSNEASNTSSNNNNNDNNNLPSSGSAVTSPSLSSSSSTSSSGVQMSELMQMTQFMQSMSPAEIQQMASLMGLSADQLRQTAQIIGSMPEAQLNEFMMQAMGSSPSSVSSLMNSGSNTGVGGMGGPQMPVVRLTEEDFAAVERLTEMGFDRSEAAQAFLACDKNEVLAANFLMDSISEGGSGGGGFFGTDDGNGGSGGGGDSNPDEDDADDMYD